MQILCYACCGHTSILHLISAYAMRVAQRHIQAVYSNLVATVRNHRN